MKSLSASALNGGVPLLSGLVVVASALLPSSWVLLVPECVMLALASARSRLLVGCSLALIGGTVALIEIGRPATTIQSSGWAKPAWTLAVSLFCFTASSAKPKTTLDIFAMCLALATIALNRA